MRVPAYSPNVVAEHATALLLEINPKVVFNVDENNKNYKVNNNLLTSLDGLTIYLAANGFDYNEYILTIEKHY